MSYVMGRALLYCSVWIHQEELHQPLQFSLAVAVVVSPLQDVLAQWRWQR